MHLCSTGQKHAAPADGHRWPIFQEDSPQKTNFHPFQAQFQGFQAKRAKTHFLCQNQNLTSTTPAIAYSLLNKFKGGYSSPNILTISLNCQKVQRTRHFLLLFHGFPAIFHFSYATPGIFDEPRFQRYWEQKKFITSLVESREQNTRFWLDSSIRGSPCIFPFQWPLILGNAVRETLCRDKL